MIRSRRVLSGAPNEARFGFAQAARGGDVAWIAGQVGMDNATGRLEEGASLGDRLARALGNVVATGRAAGVEPRGLLHLQIHADTMTESDGPAMRDAWSAVLGDARPAASLVHVAGLGSQAYRVEVSGVGTTTGNRISTSGGHMLWPDGPLVAAATRAGNHLHVGAQGPPAEVRGTGLQAELDGAIGAVRTSLQALGADLCDVVETRVFVVGPLVAADFDGLCSAHAKAFGDVRPASTMIVVEAVPWADARVQVAATAVSGV